MHEWSLLRIACEYSAINFESYTSPIKMSVPKKEERLGEKQ
jgi:hypothetical protein